MKAERKKITADQILDLYAQAKKSRGVKKEEIMKMNVRFQRTVVIFCQFYLMERKILPHLLCLMRRI